MAEDMLDIVMNALRVSIFVTYVITVHWMRLEVDF